jgi:hypothetical protein
LLYLRQPTLVVEYFLRGTTATEEDNRPIGLDPGRIADAEEAFLEAKMEKGPWNPPPD